MENKDEQIKKILSLTCKKNIKIYKLSQLGMPVAQIAPLVGTNTGNVYNVLKDYREHPERAEMADKIN